MARLSDYPAKAIPTRADLVPLLDAAASSALKKATAGSIAALPLVLNTQTADYTLALADVGAVVEIDSASPQVVTVPPNSSAAFPIGAFMEIARLGAGSVLITPGSGVTIRSSGLLEITEQYGAVAIRKRATDEWVLSTQPSATPPGNVGGQWDFSVADNSGLTHTLGLL